MFLKTFYNNLISVIFHYINKNFIISNNCKKFYFKKSKIIARKKYYIFSYHHMVFNKNKYKKNFYKIRTLFYQFYIDKIFPSKNIFNIANILNLNNSLNQN